MSEQIRRKLNNVHIREIRHPTAGFFKFYCGTNKFRCILSEWPVKADLLASLLVLFTVQVVAREGRRAQKGNMGPAESGRSVKKS